MKGDPAYLKFLVSTTCTTAVIAVVYLLGAMLSVFFQSFKEEPMKKCLTLYPSKKVTITRCEVVKP